MLCKATHKTPRLDTCERYFLAYSEIVEGLLMTPEVVLRKHYFELFKARHPDAIEYSEFMENEFVNLEEQRNARFEDNLQFMTEKNYKPKQWDQAVETIHSFFKAVHINPDSGYDVDPLDSYNLKVIGRNNRGRTARLGHSETLRSYRAIKSASQSGSKICLYVNAVTPHYSHADRNSMRKHGNCTYITKPEIYKRYRNTEDVLFYRYWFFDIDHQRWDRADLESVLDQLGLTPLIAALVETSTKKFHLWIRMVELSEGASRFPGKLTPQIDVMMNSPLWNAYEYNHDYSQYYTRLDTKRPQLRSHGFWPSQFKRQQQLWGYINHQLGGDVSVSNPLRIAQLPGVFHHRTGELTVLHYANPNSEVLTLNKAAVLVNGLIDRLGPANSPKPKKPVVRAISFGSSRTPKDTNAYLAENPRIQLPVSVDERNIYGQRNACLKALAQPACKYIEQGSLESATDFWNKIIWPFFKGKASKDLISFPDSEWHLKKFLSLLNSSFKNKQFVGGQSVTNSVVTDISVGSLLSNSINNAVQVLTKLDIYDSIVRNEHRLPSKNPGAFKAFHLRPWDEQTKQTTAKYQKFLAPYFGMALGRGTDIDQFVPDQFVASAARAYGTDPVNLRFIKFFFSTRALQFMGIAADIIQLKKNLERAGILLNLGFPQVKTDDHGVPYGNSEFAQDLIIALNTQPEICLPLEEQATQDQMEEVLQPSDKALSKNRKNGESRRKAKHQLPSCCLDGAVYGALPLTGMTTFSKTVPDFTIAHYMLHIRPPIPELLDTS